VDDGAAYAESVTNGDAPDPANHWNNAYAEGGRDRSWYQDHASTSMELIQQSGSEKRSIIDIGGGASTLVDGLLTAGYDDIAVLDIAPAGLDAARTRLGDRALTVDWLVADLLTWQPPRTFDIWHDRAVLHFLTTPEGRAAYRDVMLAATHPGSRVVIGVFGVDGPTSCSGLPVQRYDAAALADVLGPEFATIDTRTERHVTPSGSVQHFQWIAATRRD